METNLLLDPRAWMVLVRAIRRAETDLQNIVWSDETSVNWNAAKTRKDAAYHALGKAILAAPWKWQAGGALITERSGAHGWDRILFVQRRRVATCSYNGWVVMIDRAESEAEWRAIRRFRSEHSAAYKVERSRLIKDLKAASFDEPRDFGGWRYCSGQEGGVFFRPGLEKPVHVGANSPLAMTAKVRLENARREREEAIEKQREAYDDSWENGGRRAVRTRHMN